MATATPICTLYTVQYGDFAHLDNYNLYVGNESQPSKNVLCGKAMQKSGWFKCPEGTQGIYAGA